MLRERPKMTSFYKQSLKNQIIKRYSQKNRRQKQISRLRFLIFNRNCNTSSTHRRSQLQARESSRGPSTVQGLRNTSATPPSLLPAPMPAKDTTASILV